MSIIRHLLKPISAQKYARGNAAGNVRAAMPTERCQNVFVLTRRMQNILLIDEDRRFFLQVLIDNRSDN